MARRKKNDCISVKKNQYFSWHITIFEKHEKLPVAFAQLLCELQLIIWWIKNSLEWWIRNLMNSKVCMSKQTNCELQKNGIAHSEGAEVSELSRNYLILKKLKKLAFRFSEYIKAFSINQLINTCKFSIAYHEPFHKNVFYFPPW